MPRKSLVDLLLTKEDRAAFDRMIGEGKVSIDDLVNWLHGRGYEISRSSVHRHATKVDAVAEKLRQSRAITEALAKQLGDAGTQGEQGRLLVELTQSLVFDFLTKAAGDDDDKPSLAPQDIMQLGKGLSELAKSARYSQDFETKIKELAEKAAREEAAQRVKEVLKDSESKGISSDTVRLIMDRILGRS